MSNIPEARKVLKALLPELLDHQRKKLNYAISLMLRRKAIRRAPQRHKPLTKEQVKKIRAYTYNHPTIHLQDIARRFHTNSGRVSEAIHGLRNGR